MLFIIGFIVVLGAIGGGYGGNGGHFGVLWQPFEFIIILGSAIGGFIIGNPMSVIKATGGGLGTVVKGVPYGGKKPYLDLIGFFFELAKAMRTKGIKEVETHIDHPHDSALFKKYPSLMNDHHVEQFICDNIRLIVMGSGSPNQLDELMDEEIHIHHQERHAVVAALQNIADGTPALGIVAAVLGVIHTMGSITEPPEILGELIGAALVGTFFGVLVAYGLIGPMARNLEGAYAAEGAFYGCVKVAILNFARQLSPQLIAEFTRKSIPGALKPSFNDVETYLAETAK